MVGKSGTGDFVETADKFGIDFVETADKSGIGEFVETADKYGIGDFVATADKSGIGHFVETADKYGIGHFAETADKSGIGHLVETADKSGIGHLVEMADKPGVLEEPDKQKDTVNSVLEDTKALEVVPHEQQDIANWVPEAMRIFVDLESYYKKNFDPEAFESEVVLGQYGGFEKEQPHVSSNHHKHH